jgi:hypothetical protein
MVLRSLVVVSGLDDRGVADGSDRGRRSSWFGNANAPPGGSMDMRVEVVFYGE